MDLLWKKEANQQFFYDIFETVDKFAKYEFYVNKQTDLNPLLQRNQKCDQLSMDFRRQGNKKLANEAYRDAMELYNRSLSFAEIGSETVSLVYANRSLCFLKLKMYQKCLIDIELAIKANYPEHLMHKLKSRRADCVQLMETTEAFQELWPKSQLSFEADETFTQMANVLQIECNEKFGRHFVAKSDIEVGKTILMEEAFIAKVPQTPKSTTVMCDTCFKTSMNFIACDQCTVLFCDTDCILKNIFHKFECTDCHPDTIIQYFFRSVIRAIETFQNVDDLMEFVQNAVARQKKKEIPSSIEGLQSKYLAFLELSAHVTTAKWENMIRAGYTVYAFLMKQNSLQEMFATVEKQRFLMHLIVFHCLILVTNSLTHNDSGSIAFILASYFNHSCAPNVLACQKGNVRMIITLRPIKKGQQLFINYLSQNEHVDNLYRKFGCRCECEKCQSDYKPYKLPVTEELAYLGQQYINRHELMKNEKNTKYDESDSRQMQKSCIDFLTKYGSMLWNDDLQFVADRYEFLLNENNR